MDISIASDNSKVEPSGFSFYVTGGTMPVNALSYITRDADEQLYQTLKNGELCYVLNARQMGKSSLVNRAAVRLREEGFAVAQLDLTAVGQNLTASQWYGGMLNLLGQQIGLEDQLEDFWLDREDLGPLQRFFTAIKTVALPKLAERRLVIAIDEIDAVQSIKTFNTDEFFAGIRSFYIERSQGESNKVGFCLLGTATPSDLIRDPRITPFNIGKRIELKDFTEQEATSLAGRLPGSDPTLARILYWTGGHPFLTQTLCQATVTISQSNVDSVVATMYLAHGKRDTDDNLKLVSNRLLLADCDQFALLTLYRRIWQGKRTPDDDTNRLCDILKLSGAVRVEGGLLRVRNNIYRRVFDEKWIETHLPDADVRRQRASFARGLSLAGAIALLIIAAIGSLAFYARKETIRANQKTDEAENASYVANLNLIQREWDASNLAQVNALLDETKSSRFRSFEWGYWSHLSHNARLTVRFGAKDLLDATLSPDGKRIATVRRSGEVTIWNVEAGKEIAKSTRTNKRTEYLSSIYYSPEGNKLITSDWGKFHIRDAITGYISRSVETHKNIPVETIALSKDGKWILTGDSDGSTTLWDEKTGNRIRELPGDIWVASVSISPNGNQAVSGYMDGTARVWDLRTGKCLATYTHGSNPFRKLNYQQQMEFGKKHGANAVSFSPDGKSIIVCAGKNASLYELSTGKLLSDLESDKGTITTATFSPDGQYIAVGADYGSLKLWDTATGEEKWATNGHRGGVSSIAFTNDNRWLVSCGLDGTARVWSVINESVIERRGNFGNFGIALSPDGLYIASRNHKMLRIWNTSHFEQAPVVVQEFDLKTLTGHLNGLLFSPNGKFILIGEDEVVNVLDSSTRRRLYKFEDFSGRTKGPREVSLACSPNSGTCAACCGDIIKIWSLETRDVKQSIKVDGYSQAMAFSPDGKYLYTTESGVHVWDVASGKLIGRLNGDQQTVRSFTFSPDGHTVVTGGDDAVGRVWDRVTNRLLLELHGHRRRIGAVSFSADGKRILTASEDKTMRLWDTRTGKQLLVIPSDSYVSVALSPDGKRIYVGGPGINVFYSD